jgi:rubrerythrin
MKRRAWTLQRNAADATDEKEKKIFKFLIEQEDSHYKVIEQLIEMVKRPDEWVESAEFGLRKEY